MRLLGLQLLCTAERARNGNRVTVTQQLSRRGPLFRAPPQKACREHHLPLGAVGQWASGLRWGYIEGPVRGSVGKEERSPSRGLRSHRSAPAHLASRPGETLGQGEAPLPPSLEGSGTHILPPPCLSWGIPVSPRGWGGRAPSSSGVLVASRAHTLLSFVDKGWD